MLDATLPTPADLLSDALDRFHADPDADVADLIAACPEPEREEFASTVEFTRWIKREPHRTMMVATLIDHARMRPAARERLCEALEAMRRKRMGRDYA